MNVLKIVQFRRYSTNVKNIKDKNKMENMNRILLKIVSFRRYEYECADNSSIQKIFNKSGKKAKKWKI